MNDYKIGPIGSLSEDVVNRTILPEFIKIGTVFRFFKYTYYVLYRYNKNDKEVMGMLVKLEFEFRNPRWFIANDEKLQDYEGVVADYLVY